MSKVKSVCLLTLLVGLVLMLVACSAGETSSESNQIELEFVNWATAEKATEEKINKVIDAFESENPNIKIKPVTVPFSEIQNQLTVMSNGGNAPDIAQVDASTGVSLAAMGVLQPVDDLLSQDYESDLISSYYDTGLYEDKHYLVPWTGGINGFWYNKKIMKEAGLDPNKPPKTMVELDSAMEAVKKLPDVIPLQFDTSPRAFAATFQWSFMATIDKIPFDNENVQVDELTKYGEWLRKLVEKEYTLPGKKLGEFRPLAAQNRLAFAFDAPLFKGTVQSFDDAITDEVFNETWGVTTLPAGEDGKSYSAIGGSDHFTAVFEDSEHKKEAVKFLEFLANSDVALEEYVMPMGNLPVTSSAAERFPELKESPHMKVFLNDILPTAIVPPFGADYADMATTFATQMQELITTKTSIQEILDQIQKDLDTVTADNE
ncbi:ABC transporter substrate-binding protein [Virgibacillus ndiopensis]|uniref:ABC transporter substrate-binding protein n=1 Tax=Virgibacillus ndiopensis TaxID=2004408 RepID=UPI000C069FCC|nr:sugar ABC transporter substrate-binding protein [Virgibacillus ndiopensis]